MKISKNQRILNQIAAIRDAHSEMEYIFKHGSCLNFFCILRSIYPEAEAFFNIDHVVTRIDGKFYDVTGRVNGRDFKPFTSFFNKRGNTRSFTQMMRAEAPLIRDKTR